MSTQAIDPIRSLDSTRFAQIPDDHMPDLFKSAVIPRDRLEQSNIPLDYTTYLTIGGGIGSFVWVDNLVVRGVNPSQIVSIGMEDKPYGRYKRLCEQSQIPSAERLRSDSGATLDNIWGFPGYAVREAVRDVAHFNVKRGIGHLARIFAEPLVDVYTPVSGDVYESIDREAERIGWSQIARMGRVHCIRKTDDGYYAVLYTMRKRNGGYTGKVILTRYLYIAVGYPGARVLPELKELRLTHGIDGKSPAVNAYEDHSHIYEHLQRHGGTVIVRGRGIVASRVLQRLCESRMMNQNIHIIHLMRRPVPSASEHRGNRRGLASHWEMQPFNFPKSAWGGHMQKEFANSTDRTRDELLDSWGGTTTAPRSNWQNIVERGQREGWYQILFGNVTEIHMEDNSQLCVCIETAGQQKQIQAQCDALIDATGLDANLKNHSLYCDLIEMYPIDLNVKGRLDVSDDFEIRAMRTPHGRMYAGGAMTMGSKYAPVDSFLGLQYCAQMSVADMFDQRAPSLKRLTPKRSLNQWMRWMIGVKP